jgi:hypothetical protein
VTIAITYILLVTAALLVSTEGCWRVRRDEYNGE